MFLWWSFWTGRWMCCSLPAAAPLFPLRWTRTSAHTTSYRWGNKRDVMDAHLLTTVPPDCVSPVFVMCPNVHFSWLITAGPHCIDQLVASADAAHHSLSQPGLWHAYRLATRGHHQYWRNNALFFIGRDIFLWYLLHPCPGCLPSGSPLCAPLCRLQVGLAGCQLAQVKRVLNLFLILTIQGDNLLA